MILIFLYFGNQHPRKKPNTSYGVNRLPENTCNKSNFRTNVLFTGGTACFDSSRIDPYAKSARSALSVKVVSVYASMKITQGSRRLAIIKVRTRSYPGVQSLAYFYFQPNRRPFYSVFLNDAFTCRPNRPYVPITFIGL